MNDESILNSIETEYLSIERKNAWALVYNKINQQCQSYPYKCNEANKLENKAFNRYRDVSPYDHSRVILGRSKHDYINANLIQLSERRQSQLDSAINLFLEVGFHYLDHVSQINRACRQYVLTQGPLEGTIADFWVMVWEQNTTVIVMLNKLVEKNERKCCRYWPRSSEGSKSTYDEVKLVVEKLNQEHFYHYTIREFRITDMTTAKSREVIQFHYTTWPDFGVPSSPVAFLEFLNRVRMSGGLEPEVGPPIVHCSAGIGRSGTFCLVDSCLAIVEKEGVNNVNVQDILLEMRRDRMGLIQTPDQLRFSYVAIIDGIFRLQPTFQIATDDPEESIYSDVEEETPPPPPRSESLSRAPARPLPAIPISLSLGDLNESVYQATLSPPITISSDSEDDVEAATYYESPINVIDSESDDCGEGTSTSTLRQRKSATLAERVAEMKKRAHEAEQWVNMKRRTRPEGTPQEDSAC